MSPHAIHHRMRLAVATATLLVISPMTARAQPSGPEAPRPQAANVEEDAAARFKQGLKLFDDGDYTLALVEFERAYQLAPNYRALYNIALVNAQLGRYAAAKRALEQYLRDGGAQVAPERQAQVRSRLAELKLRTATLDVSTNVPGAEILLDGKPLTVSPLLHGPVLIDAGEHTLRASAEGYEPALRTLTLAGADAAVVHFDLVATRRASPPPPLGRRKPFIPGLTATGALAAGAIAGGIVMLSARSSLTSLQNTPGSSSQTRSRLASEVNTAALVADVLTGLTVVTGGISLYLSLRVDSSPHAPEIALCPSHVTFSGTF